MLTRPTANTCWTCWASEPLSQSEPDSSPKAMEVRFNLKAGFKGPTHDQPLMVLSRGETYAAVDTTPTSGRWCVERSAARGTSG